MEIDENGRLEQRTKNKEQKRETKKEAEITLIRINPDKKDFDIFDEISVIQDFIYKYGVKLEEQSAKKSLIEDTERLNKMVKQLCI